MPEIFMPRLSDTMEEGTISRWLKREGDQIRRGDVLAEIETDKAVMELEAYEEGPLTRILVPEGGAVPIGAPVAVVGTGAGTETGTSTGTSTGAGAEAGAEPGQPARPPATPEPATPEPTAPEQAAPAQPSEPVSPIRLPSSPLSRRLASRHGIDITTLTGSGPGGRVIRADVEEAIARRDERPATTRTARTARPEAASPAEPTPRASRAEEKTPERAETVREGEEREIEKAEKAGDVEEVPLTAVRRITARRLIQSVQQAPHFYLTTMVDAEPLLAFRAEVNTRLGERGPRVTVTDLIVKACAIELREHPEVNASWADTRILRHRRVHIGIAVALDDGLIVPVVHDADVRTLTEIAREAHALADKARAGRLTLDELGGGTFTVSNLGPFGIDHFTAVINPPQAAILAVGAAQPQPVVRDGELAVGTMMALTLSIDHRVLDGATGAAFLTGLKELLQQPLRMVV
ncbi:dihydrolipoamide acetyltransferase family protein [Sphaerimonospora thailandensis]|uniref:Dihydrolipoamide acetyltransferase component of pyruvate dehydrogenase complex n=1 Tax=Sphaerimonospora thailandensis TaxID=795644 RepID=A0A8J3W160_9ACTN|nr:dihydrolipoamide acetyltransferase family protein [Sphaerimonospora thailandensis]GIH71793.1 acetyltransferase component of pyruvate dehydrogenase complex [Sphaerimonospora thailandensis]